MISVIVKWLYYILICYSCITNYYEADARHCETSEADLAKLEEFGLYYSFESLKRAFNKKDFIVDEESKYNYVGRLITDYERRCPSNLTAVKNRFPFIVVESLLWKCGREVSWNLARRMEAKGIQSPPLYMTGIHKKNMHGEVFRNLFTTLGNYASACEAMKLTEFYPIIIQTHFLYQATFGIAKKFSWDLPSLQSDVFYWPKDMFKPDLIIFINLPLLTYQKLVVNPFRETLINAYRSWQEPKLFELNQSSSFSEISDMALKVVNRELNKSY